MNQKRASSKYHSTLTSIHDQQGALIDLDCPASPDEIKLIILPSVNKQSISHYTLTILKEILFRSCEWTATITSASRTAEDQARVMYGNLIGKGPKQGVKKQKKLYAEPGKAVIAVFENGRRAKLEKEEIIKKMIEKIYELGPSNVSKHISNPKILNVIDISPRTISNKKLFEQTVYQDSRVKKFLNPQHNDPCYHLEIPQVN